MEPGDDDPWTTESDESWYPAAQDQVWIEVDWDPPEPAGTLWFPDGTYIEVEQDRAPFGFGRWAYENGGAMSLLEEARQLNGGPGGKCGIGRALAAMSPKERAEWDELLAAPIEDIQHAAIVRVFEAHDIITTGTTVGRHRKGQCKCR